MEVVFLMLTLVVVVFGFCKREFADFVINLLYIRKLALYMENCVRDIVFVLNKSYYY